jgi:hypothetical protein
MSPLPLRRRGQETTNNHHHVHSYILLKLTCIYTCIYICISILWRIKSDSEPFKSSSSQYYCSCTNVDDVYSGLLHISTVMLVFILVCFIPAILFSFIQLQDPHTCELIMVLCIAHVHVKHVYMLKCAADGACHHYTPAS